MDSGGEGTFSETDLAILESLVPSPAHLQPHTTTTTLDGLLRIPLQLKEDLAEGCGGKLWPAGIVLARYIVRMYGGVDGDGGLAGKKMYVGGSFACILNGRMLVILGVEIRVVASSRRSAGDERIPLYLYVNTMV
jgi:hypothetical protein